MTEKTSHLEAIETGGVVAVRHATFRPRGVGLPRDAGRVLDVLAHREPLVASRARAHAFRDRPREDELAVDLAAEIRMVDAPSEGSRRELRRVLCDELPRRVDDPWPLIADAVD